MTRDAFFRAQEIKKKLDVTHQLTKAGNFVFGEDIPVDLVERLEAEIHRYENELEDEFAALSGDYIEED